MDGTIIQQGTFTANGAAITIPIRSDVDWMQVVNYTIAAADQTTAIGFQYFWQRGMSTGTGLVYKKSNAVNAANLVDDLADGFYLIDSSVNIPEAALTGTTITEAAPAVASVTNTYSNGDIVRIIASDKMKTINGLDFTIGSASGSDFALAYLDTTAATGTWTASTAFKVRRLPFNPIFYPRARYVTNVSNAAQAIVTMAVTHGFTIGQVVRLIIPQNTFTMNIPASANTVTASSGEVQATIVAIGAADESAFTNTITLDVDSTAWGAFAWPDSVTTTKLTHAQVVPVGEDTAEALSQSTNILADSTINRAYIGMRLGGGANKPGGANGNVMYWIAGKSYSANEITPLTASQM